MHDADPGGRAEAAVRQELADMLFGFVRTQALYVCTLLGLPDLVGAEPVDAGELATEGLG